MKPQYIDCKTCNGRVEVKRQACREDASCDELVASCHGVWLVEIVSKRSTPREMLGFLTKTTRMPPKSEVEAVGP